MPPKVEAVILAALLVGAWILMENSHRIDVSPSVDNAARVSLSTVPTCPPAQRAQRYWIMSAVAAEASGAAVPSDGIGNDVVDTCATAGD